MSTYEQRKAKRRRVKPGYPRTEKFTDPEELAAYFGRDSITCLLCGRNFRKLGIHLLRCHEMTPDEYREAYGIPWTYGLCCEETRDAHAADAKEKMESGVFRPADAATQEMARSAPRRQRAPVSNERLRRGNASRRVHPPRTVAKRGTAEFVEVMRQRPQCSPPSPDFVMYWDGKEQTDEHVLKRTGSPKRRK